MARPIKRRTVQSYKRDIESLGRLRTAILQDTNIDWTDQNDAIEGIDILIPRLIKLSHKIASKKVA